MFSKGQTEALGTMFRPPSVCAHMPQDNKPMNDLHYPDLHTLNHQYCEMPIVPKLGTPEESLEIIRTIFKVCGS